MSDSNFSIRLTPLKGLRGLASLTIAIPHHRNLNDKWNGRIIDTNPFQDQPVPDYKFGWLGVELFFVLSGFIFFWKNGKMIGNKAIALTKFRGPITRAGYGIFAGSLLHLLYNNVKNAGKFMEYTGAAALPGAVLIVTGIQSFINGNSAMALYLGPRSTGTSRYASSPC